MSNIPVVLIEGDGIGPEICGALKSIFSAAKVPIDWVEAWAGLGAHDKFGHPCPASTIETIARHGVAIKGPTTTPIGGGHKSVNVTIRKALDLYANVRPCRTIPGVESRYPNVDLVIVRENIEDTYGGIEHMQSPDVAQCLRLITRPGTRKICRYTFDLARRERRRRVACVHKANIMKHTDGLFLEVFREIAASYTDLEASDVIVDNCCMQLVSRPEQFDVLVLPNLFGDIVSDLCAGIVGGLGVAPGGNIGDRVAVFEAVHGSAPDIAGKGLANPTAILLSSVAMLKHLSLLEHAALIERSLIETLQSGTRTRDLKGSASTDEFAAAVCRAITTHGAPKAAVGSVPKSGGGGAETPSTKTERRLVGFDVFLEHDKGVPPLPAQLGPMKLSIISNRGQKVWPGKAPEILLVDIYRCRYIAPTAVPESEVLAALSALTDAGYTWVHVEKLHEFAGKAGFSQVQGE